MDVKNIAKLINKHVGNPNSGRSDVAPNLRNGARLVLDQLLRGNSLTGGVVSVLTNLQLLATGAPRFAVCLPINEISTERDIYFELRKLGR